MNWISIDIHVFVIIWFRPACREALSSAARWSCRTTLTWTRHAVDVESVLLRARDSSVGEFPSNRSNSIHAVTAGHIPLLRYTCRYCGTHPATAGRMPLLLYTCRYCGTHAVTAVHTAAAVGVLSLWHAFINGWIWIDLMTFDNFLRTFCEIQPKK